MARASDGGWDFIQVGKTYQYKEEWFIARVKVLEDNSDEKYYRFKLRVEKSNIEPHQLEFVVEHIKEPGGYWSGMSQFYEHEEYLIDNWDAT